MDKNTNSKKQEELSPEELWKKVSQQLSSKKYETASKIAYNTMYDLSSLKSEIRKITTERLHGTTGDEHGRCEGGRQDERRQQFLRCETENSLLNIPYFKEIEPNYPVKKRKKTPAFFPKHPYVMFNNPNFYKKFDLDTLFFIFYYFKGNVQQTYAAIRLKYYAWRYHLKYKMWFQRLDEPNLITCEYEKGEFLFFDYETTWNFMKKNDFVFEYYYLEHNEYY